MTTPSDAARQHFSTGGADYATFRPRWPRAMAEALAAAAPKRSLAVDVGCGSGQLTTQLGPLFDCVLGFDVSPDQLAAAEPAAGVIYAAAAAEALPVCDGTAALITVAQAAHWLDLPRFYAEAVRIARPGALLALASYGPAEVDGPLAPAFARLRDVVAGHWPAERIHVETGYRDLPFPFPPVDLPRLAIEVCWPAEQLSGYVETWSGTRRARAAGDGAGIDAFAAAVRAAAGSEVHLRFPIAVRAGRIG
ncbi:class I SAM-dependent methyltransferase [Paracoccus suum]|uniref:Class I SAM-dependent methyltransferase n=1 Tax=Paracoccus suum TaxID=2259340 RepID=A0A344PGH9_9RHOB|nr:class I SAM-dependent methyltransferase [Paracoccus suum]AXC48484.1 class I SAM-dependent methyltransferase [Paracoccus suum]